MLTSRDLAELLAETPPCEPSEIAKNPVGYGFQQFRSANDSANYAKLLTDSELTSSQTSQTSQSSESGAQPISEPFLATSQTSHGGIAANDAESLTNESDDFWEKLCDRISECDRLINALCDLREDDDAHRTDLLAVRKRMAPQMLITDIDYLKAEIAALTPPAPAQTRGRCIECRHFALAGIGQRCAHASRTAPDEPPRAECLPDQQCPLFVHWRKP